MLIQRAKDSAVKLYRHFMHDSLHRNSLFLIASNGLSALLGFLFWGIATHRYTPAEIGVITALIGFSSFIVQFSQLGYVNGVIRHLASRKDKNALISSVLLVVALLTAVSSVAFLLAVHLILPKAAFITHGGIAILSFIVYIVASAYSSIMDGIFVSYRATQFILLRNVTLSIVKILAMFCLAQSILGLFMSVVVATVLAMFVGLVPLLTKFTYRPVRQAVEGFRVITRFSVVNYVSSGTASFVLAIIPIIIVRRLGASDAAYYYIAYSIASVLNFIPNGISQSLFAEGSANENSLRTSTHKSLKLTAALMLPVAAILILCGSPILSAFGSGYAGHALACFYLLVLTALLSPINWIGDNILNVRKRMKLYSFTNIFSALTTILFMLPFLKYGLIGVGLGWFTSELATALLYLYIFREHLVRGARPA